MSSNRHRYLEEADTTPVSDEPDSTPVGEHTHEQPKGAQRALMVAVLFLLVTTAGFGFLSYQTDQRLSALEDYVAGRGQQRDAENQALNDRLDQAVCDLLDSLPAGGLFDPIRARYGCGPGIPVDQLDPGAAQNLADILGSLDPTAPPEPAPETTEPAGPTSGPGDLPPGAPAGAQPSPMGQAPTPTPAPTTEPAAPTTAPLVDLSTLTDRLCETVGICA